jgi:hypothetical protein
MGDEDRGWPLGEAQIRAKYYALVKRDLEREMLEARAKELEQVPVALPKSRSTRDAYSRAQSLQRVLRRAGLADGRGSHSVPVSSPSSLEHHQTSRPPPPNHGLVTLQDMLALDPVNPPKPTRLCPELHGKRTKFLAKQFKLISNSITAPRRNITILAKATLPSSDPFVAETLQRDQLQERIRVHDCDQPSTDPRLHSPSPSPSCHANSPCSVISEENEPTGPRSKLTRERWTSREIFGSFDFGGELDIDGTITETKNPNHDPGSESSSSWSLGMQNHGSDSPAFRFRYGFVIFAVCFVADGSVDSPSSGMRSPRQSLATTSSTELRGRGVERLGGRMKVTSPSSLFRDGPWYAPRREQLSSPNAPRNLSRKLSTSFNKRRRQATQVQPQRAESKPVKLGATCNGSLTLEIAGLLSGFKVKAKSSGGNGRILEQEATTAFQDDIAQLMLDRSESSEIGDIEEFLDGYMRLRTPFYLEIVEEFFRTVSYDCYRRPLEVKKLPH